MDTLGGLGLLGCTSPAPSFLLYGADSCLEACSWSCATPIHVYCTLVFSTKSCQWCCESRQVFRWTYHV